MVQHGRDLGVVMDVDANGYLLDASAWRSEFAAENAARDGIALGEEHWQVIRFLRDYYAEFGVSPPMRVLVKAMAARTGNAPTSRRLYQLFPQGPAKQACKYAGLPKPVSCI